MIKPQEAFNFYSHLAGVIAAVLGTVFLVVNALDSASALTVALVYGLSLIFLFTASSLYHAFKQEENELSFWRKMDRLAIYFMIAGSYTPVCYFFVDDAWRIPMITIQWSLVAFGVFSQIYFPRAPRWLYVAIYLTMGWLLVFPLGHVIEVMTNTQVWLLIGGGVAFTVGAVIYGVKRPLMFPGRFSFHELFHVMVLIGGGMHYALIYSAYANPIA